MAQYFTGKKAAGYVVVNDPTITGGKIELETRMCAHCGFHGLYKPGVAKIYAAGKNFINGICYRCQGLTCMRKECNIKCEVLEKRLEKMEKGAILI